MDPAIPVAPLYFSLTAEQKAFFLAELQVLREMRDELKKPLPPLQWPYGHSTPPAPQEAPKEQAISEEDAEITAEKQEERRPLPLYQATVEDADDDKEITSTLSTKARLCTAPASRDPAVCFSNAPLFAYQKATFLVSSLTSFFGSLLTSFFGSTSRFGYIECTESMEASGQG